MPFFGPIGDFSKNPIEFLTRMAKDYDGFAYARIMGKDFYLISDPVEIEAVLIKHAADAGKDEFVGSILSRALGRGLVTSSGDFWRRQRKLVAFAFTPARIKAYGESMVDCVERGMADWRSDSVVNLHQEMSRFTVEIVAQTLFGAAVNEDAQVVAQALDVLNEYFANSPEAMMRVPTYVPTPRHLRFRRALRQIDAVLYRIIAERRREGDDRRDLLSALLRAQDDDGSALSDEQLRDECVTLFVAGHETTALALTHALHLLSINPAALARLERELFEVLGDGLPSYDDLKQLEYTHHVLRESMRLFPPIWIMGRQVEREFSLRGYELPKGAQLIFSQWVVHRDPRFFPEPEEFRPERWEKTSERALPRLAYFPFGAGPRVCVGNHFAMMEAVLLLARICQRYRVEALAGEKLEFAPSITLRPKGDGLRVRVRARGAEGLARAV